jgi:hypothetical protein
MVRRPVDGRHGLDVTVFTKNRDRLLDGDVARLLLNTVINDPAVGTLLSDDHFAVDGTLIETWASMKSVQPKDGNAPPPGPGRNGERDFRGETRSWQLSASSPGARLAALRLRNGDGSVNRHPFCGAASFAPLVEAEALSWAGPISCVDSKIFSVADLFPSRSATPFALPVSLSAKARLPMIRLFGVVCSITPRSNFAAASGLPRSSSETARSFATILS